MIRLLADENIAAPLVRTLRDAGFDVAYVAELSAGITDDQVLALARKDRRLLLTEDKDFGELVFRVKRDLEGVIMLRLPKEQGAQQSNRVVAVLSNYADRFVGHYTVVESTRVRFRPFPDPEPVS